MGFIPSSIPFLGSQKEDTRQAIKRSPGVLFVNAKSRRGEEWFDHAHETLRSMGVLVERAHAFREPKALMTAVQKAVIDGYKEVYVGGGDGTFGSIAQYLARQDVTLGVLPLGTGNAFARDLKIPSEVESACKIIAEGKTFDVDLGWMGDRAFVNIATVGLTTHIAEGLDDRLKKKVGRAVYLASVARALAVLKPFRAELEVDGQMDAFEAMQIVIGNGRYHAGPFAIAPEACIREGKLSIYAVTGRDKGAFLKFASHLAVGKHIDLDEVYGYHGVKGRLATYPKQRMVVDGEIVGKTPIEFRADPHAIRVFAPAL